MSRDRFSVVPEQLKPPKRDGSILLDEGSPEERAAAVQRAIANESRRRAQARAHRRSPNETSLGEELGIDPNEQLFSDNPLRQLAAPILSQRYNPIALGGAYTDALTFGNAAELAGLVDTLPDSGFPEWYQDNILDIARPSTPLRENYDQPHPTYDDAHRRAEALLSQEYERNPGSAATGTLAGIANVAATPLLGAPGSGGRLAQMARMARPAAIVGTVAGGLGGALTEPEDRAGGAVRGAVRGGLTGTAAGLLGAAAPMARTAAAGLGIGGRLAIPAIIGGTGMIGGALGTPSDRFEGAARGGAAGLGLGLLGALRPGEVASGLLGGAGYGVASTPGSGDDTGLGDYLQQAYHGAGVGGAIEGGLGLGSGLLRLLGRNPSGAAPREAPPVREIDEAALMSGDDPLVGDVAPVGEGPVLTPEEIVQRIRANDRSAGAEAMGSMVDVDPAYDRLHSLNARGAGALSAMRQGASAFGSVEGLVRELQSMGLAREGTVYSRPAEYARVLAARDALGRELAQTHGQIAARGLTTSSAPISDRFEESADDLLRRSPEDPETIAAARELRDYGDRFYADRDAEPLMAERLEPMDAGPPVESDVRYLGVPQELEYRPILDRLRVAGNESRMARRSAIATGSQTPRQRVASLIYRNMVPARGDIAARALSPTDLAAHQAQQRAFQATNAISPVENRLDINGVAQPADLRGAIAGIASSAAADGPIEAGASRLAATLRERLIANYQHSLRATANERVLPALGRAGERLSLTPETAARGADALRSAGPPLTAMRLRLDDVGARAFGVQDAEADSSIAEDEAEGRIENDGYDYLRELSGADPSTDAPEDDAHEAGYEFLRSLSGARHIPERTP